MQRRRSLKKNKGQDKLPASGIRGTYEYRGDEPVRKFIEQFDTLQFPPHYDYHPRHTWVTTWNDSFGMIGIDEFLAHLLVHTKSIVFPSIGSRISQGHYFCWIVEEIGTLPIVAPRSGVVVRVNPILAVSPGWLKREPYGDGWLVEVRLNGSDDDRSQLIDDREACRRFEADIQEVKKRFLSALTESHPSSGRTLADGGLPARDLQEALGARRYAEVVGPYFH